MSPSSPPEPAIQTAARLLAQGRPDEAADYLAALVAASPVYAAAHVLHATALEAAGRPDDALGAWARAATLVPHSPLVHRERSRLLAARRGASALGGDRPSGRSSTSVDPAAIAAPLLPGFEFTAGETEPSADRQPEEAALEREALPPLTDAVEPQPLDVSDLLFVPPTEAATAPEPAPPLEPESADLLPPEGDAEAEPEEPLTADETAGWIVLAEEADSPSPSSEPDVVEPEEAPDAGSQRGERLSHGYSVADELDSLISQLEDAPRIRPDPTFSGPAVSFDTAGTAEVASETLAKIYVAQGQYAEAAAVYETLADRQPARAAELLERAAEMRQKG